MRLSWNPMLVSSTYSVKHGFMLLVCSLLSMLYTTVQHTQSQNTGPYKRQGYNPEDVGLEGLQWDSAKLFEVSMISHA